MFCNNCGLNNTDTDSFCIKCGHKLANASTNDQMHTDHNQTNILTGKADAGKSLQATQSQPIISSIDTDHAAKTPAFYRQYWIFGIIFIFAPFGLIFGIVILLTGGVFKKDKEKFVSIKTSEKITLLVIALLLQLYTIFEVLN